jgi:hypothetical protein
MATFSGDAVVYPNSRRWSICQHFDVRGGPAKIVALVSAISGHRIAEISAMTCDESRACSTDRLLIRPAGEPDRRQRPPADGS